MLKTSESTESTTRPGKSIIEIGGDGVGDSGGDSGGDSSGDSGDDSNGRSSDFDRKFYSRLHTIAAPLTLILKTWSSTDSSISATPIVVEYDRIDHGGGHSSDFDRKLHPKLYTIAVPLTLMLRMSSSTESSTSTVQITVKHDEIDGGGGKLVEKLSKSRRIVRSRKTSKAWRVAKVISSEERLPKYRSSVNKELELLLKPWQFFELLLLGPEALSILLSDWQSTKAYLTFLRSSD